MKNKIQAVNDIFNRYDPIGVHHNAGNNYTDEYVNIAAQFVADALKAGTEHAFNNAMITMFSDVKYCRKYGEIRDVMLRELKHVTG